jgi:hypothetical protein
LSRHVLTPPSRGNADERCRTALSMSAIARRYRCALSMSAINERRFHRGTAAGPRRL